jgi:hypothetical protein
MKAQKNLSLDVEVVRKLEGVDNQSALVESLLREHFGMEDD